MLPPAASSDEAGDPLSLRFVYEGPRGKGI